MNVLMAPRGERESSGDQDLIRSAERFVDRDSPGVNEAERARLVEVCVGIASLYIEACETLWLLDCPMPLVSEEDGAHLDRLRVDTRTVGKALAQVRLRLGFWLWAREILRGTPLRQPRRGRPRVPLEEAEQLLLQACGGNRYGARSVASRLLRRAYRGTPLRPPKNRKSFRVNP